MLNRVKSYILSAYSDSLYRNSIYLMLSTAVMAFFGFFFWIINARLFNTEQVGIATTLISVMTLISSFSLLGLGNSLIKYLPSSERKNEKLNTSFTLVVITSLIMAVIFLTFINIFSPSFTFVKENTFFTFLFVVFIVFSSLNALLESIFIAYRSAKYVFIKNLIWSLIKLGLPILLIFLGAFGIFMSVGIGTILATIFGLVILIRKFNYSFKLFINKAIVRRMFGFSLGTYIAGFIGVFPALVLPIIITNAIGAKYSAYFYVDMMIANFLYIVPLAVSQTLFAEGSYNASELKANILKAIKIITVILIPCIFAIMFFGKYILLAFGNEYSNEGLVLLQLLAFSSVFVAINYVGNSILFIRHKIKLILLINLIGTSTILYLSHIFYTQNLLGIGLVWLIGQLVITLLFLLTFYRNNIIKWS